MAARLGRLGEAGPSDQHVVVAGPRPGGLAPRLAQLALDAVADDGAADDFGTARPRRGSSLVASSRGNQ